MVREARSGRARPSQAEQLAAAVAQHNIKVSRYPCQHRAQDLCFLNPAEPLMISTVISAQLLLPLSKARRL